MSYGQYSPEHREYIPVRPDLTAKQTPKREKHVFGSNDTGIEHVWANPLTKDGQGYYQTHATNPQRNFYFKTDADGTRVLYSYRDSYPIASRFRIGKRAVYLVRSGKAYSVTTAGHISAARNAVPDKANLFEVPYVTRYTQPKFQYADTGMPDNATHIANLADYVTRIETAIKTLARARSTWTMKQSHAQAIDTRNEAKKYAKVFRLECPKLPVVPKIDATKYAKWESFEATQAERTRALRERQAKEREEKYAEALTAWKRGENVSLPYGVSQYALLRVNEETSNPSEPARYIVQTSQNVSVPVSGKLGAARLLRFLQALKRDGRTYQRNGHTEHIGEFTVESFKPSVATANPDNSSEFEWILTAGCHRIRWSEIESISQQVFDAETEETLAGKNKIADYLEGRE